MATWLVLSRGVLPAALPRLASNLRVRLAAAALLLLSWLPFNLGTRPESYVAFGVITVVALLWRARDPAWIGWAALVAALTLPVSPSSVILAGPLLVFAPRIVVILRRGTRMDAVIDTALLGCIGASVITVIFADQTWAGLLTATDWHTFFGRHFLGMTNPTATDIFSVPISRAVSPSGRRCCSRWPCFP